MRLTVYNSKTDLLRGMRQFHTYDLLNLIDFFWYQFSESVLVPSTAWGGPGLIGKAPCSSVLFSYY